jgi:N-acetylneuraminic acid mutarotase
VAAVPYSFQAQEAANADMVDGYHGASLEESSEIDADIAAHTAIADAHHARYTDAEAWAAVVANDGPGSGLDADRVDGLHASAFADATHNHPPSNISPQGSGSGLDADMVDGLHANDLELPTGAMVLGATENETTLIAAGFSYTGHTLSNSWSARADMPTGRSYLAAAAVDGVIYVIGGRSDATNSETVNEAYDPATDSWSTKAAMPTGRWLLAAATVNGIIYAIGGEANMTPETANEAYDPATDSWTTRAPMPTGRTSLAAATVNGIIYAIVGYSATANGAYDPATDSWSTKAAMPTARYGLAAATVDGFIYAIGGWNGTSYQTANEVFDPAQWYVYRKQ